jgi:hypothetical protein
MHAFPRPNQVPAQAPIPPVSAHPIQEAPPPTQKTSPQVSRKRPKTEKTKQSRSQPKSKKETATKKLRRKANKAEVDGFDFDVAREALKLLRAANQL